MVDESWTPITLSGLESLYEVSTAGRVRRTTTGRILRPSTHSKEYRTLTLTGNGLRKSVLVHRLVLEAFRGPCPAEHESLHRDGDRANNHLDNLLWGTSTENERDKARHGTVARGERNGQAVLSTEQIHEVVRRCGAGESQRAVASAYGVSQSQVSRIVTGQRWGHLEVTITAS